MRTIQNPGTVIVSVVCCQHGDELIGQAVFEHYQQLIANFPGLQLIFANDEANRQGIRFLDTDLNRSYPGSPDGGHEAKLAAEILPIAREARYLLDLHTTTSDIVMSPIVATLGPDVRRILNLTDSREIALMSPAIASRALIGHVPAGVSLEFNHEFARTAPALAQVKFIIESLLAATTRPALERRVFNITGTIPLTPPLPPATPNFKFIKSLGIYPFLLREKAYTTFQAFSATTITKRKI